MNLFRSLILLLAVAPVAWSADEVEPKKKKLSKEDIEKAEKAVKGHLDKLKASHGKTERVDDAALDKTVPGYAFFTVMYRQFPIARQLPEGLKSANIFIVGADIKPKLINSAKDLEKFFKDNVRGVTSESKAKDAARAWLRLSQELHQDGFYKFKLEDDSTKVEGKDARTAKAKVVVTQGGNGTLEATLKLDKDGKLTALEESSKIRPGPRPICQATKLLDKDPIVRGMAEQALLCMGRSARDYLNEQKSKASPELKRAIDRIWHKIVESDR
jgi:hypothetical protein